MKIVTSSISKKELEGIAKEQFGNFVKAVVDIGQNCMAVGGDLHADEEALLLENDSEQKNLWGVNLYLDKTEDDFVEFDSMINVRPSHGNASRGVENKEIREKINRIVRELVQ